jgi:hypothetical protein
LSDSFLLIFYVRVEIRCRKKDCCLQVCRSINSKQWETPSYGF